MYSPEWLELSLAGLALALLGLTLPSLGAAYGVAFRYWRAADRASLALLVGACVLAGVLRWFVFPRWLAMVFIGYLQTQRAIELLPLAHYGAGSAAYYHAWLGWLPHDHESILWVNSVTGVVALPLVATLAARVGGSAKVGAWMALLVAATPMFVRNDNSEANNVPLLWWAAGGLLLAWEYRQRGERAMAVQAAVLLTLASIARPEAPLVVGVLLLAVVLAEPRGAGGPDRLGRILVCVGGAVCVPHLVHVATAASVVGTKGILDLAPGLVSAVVFHDPFIDPRLFPAVTVAVAVFGAMRSRRAARALLLAAACAVPYVVDLCRGNMLRVLVPTALLVTFAAAAGLVGWMGERPRARAPTLAALALTVGLTVPFVWAPTNEQAEEEFIREALAALPQEPKVFVRHGYLDLNEPGAVGVTQQHFPDYLLDRRAGPTRLLTIGEFRGAPSFEVPVYLFWGVRCSGRFRDERTPPPRGELVQPACAAMREAFRLTAVVERRVRNRGDVWLEYFSDQPELSLALYRVHPTGHARPGPGD